MPKIFTRAAALALFLIPLAGLATPIQNGDFTSDFNGWMGEVTDFNFVDSALTPAQMLASPLYGLPGGGAATVVTDPTFIHTQLSQQFDLPGIAPGESLSLGFGYDWVLTDSVDFFDFVQATLIVGVTEIDLFAGLDTSALTASGTITTDLTALAGQTVTLLFSVDDGGDDQADRLTVDNITVTAIPAAVPVPGTLALMGIALLGLGRARVCVRNRGFRV